MLTIRFSRIGKRNKAQFKIMLQESTEAPGGRHIAVLGSYDPHSKQSVIDEEKVKYWMEKGAKTSDSVHNLLVSKGIISEKKRVVKIPKKALAEEPKAEETKKEESKEEVKAGETGVEETKKTEETKKGETPKEEKASEEAPKSE